MTTKTPSKTTLPSEVQTLAEEVGRFIHYWGFKQVHGRIWTHLFVSETALDAAALIERLGVSKALVSITLADLLRYDVVQEAGKSAQGTQLYRANPDLFGSMLAVIEQREKQMLASTQAAIERLRALPGSTRDQWNLSASNLKTLQDFVQTGQGFLEALLAMKSTDFGQLRKFTQTQ